MVQSEKFSSRFSRIYFQSTGNQEKEIEGKLKIDFKEDMAQKRCEEKGCRGQNHTKICKIRYVLKSEE